MAKVFISYKNDVQPDERLAKYFVGYFKKQHHEAFTDRLIEPRTKFGPCHPKSVRRSRFSDCTAFRAFS